MRQLWIGLPFALIMACGDDAADKPVDAPPMNPDGPVDAVDNPDFTWNEGGESRIEYQAILAPNGTTNLRVRATDFYFKQKTPAIAALAQIPGCNKRGPGQTDFFPFDMGTARTALNVGTVIHPGGIKDIVNEEGSGPLPADGSGGTDGLFRKHFEHWNFFVGDNRAEEFFGKADATGKYDAPYSTLYTGSDEWPAQAFPNSHYMPSNWQVVSPGFEAIQLEADTPITFTYTTDPFVNHPEGTTLNMVVAILVAPFGPVVECVEEGLDGELTIPAEFINHARAIGQGGVLARAHVSHILHELGDGTDTVGPRTRFDAFTIWCYVTGWSAAP